MTSNADSIRYFLSDSKGNVISSKSIGVKGNRAEINLQQNTTKKLDVGANSMKIFAISNKVLKPDFYSTSFLVTENKETLPEVDQSEIKFDKYNANQIAWIIIPIIITVSAIIIVKKRKLV